MQNLIRWMQSLRGTMIRGKTVDSADIRIFDDGSATVTANLKPGSGEPEDKLFQHLRNDLCLIADIVDVASFDPNKLSWFFTDEIQESSEPLS